MQTSDAVVVDQCGRCVKIPIFPRRIISLVPSQTELLFDLGLEDEVVGITKFCIHPDKWFRTKIRIGGTKNPDLKKISALNPDLIIANKEENRKEDIDLLAEKFPVWVSDICTYDDALLMIEQVSSICGREAKGKLICNAIEKQFHELVPSVYPFRSIYLIWRNPWMGANTNTFIHDMLQRCGLVNLLEKERARYLIITTEELISLNPELVLLSSEPYPFKQKHLHELQCLMPGAKIELVDGELFSWYGSRLTKSVTYFNALIKRWT
jgi:ABC-type Fe3+-hydroxamate transport system substrate-binding protein